jgi:HK97 family phage portal protein
MLPRPSDIRSSTFHVSQTPPGWVVQGYGEDSYAGEPVTVEGALGVTAVLSGFTILSEDTSSLPLITYRRLKRGKERAYNSPMYKLLHDQPNPEHTSMVYREFIMGHLLGWGNHYSQKVWDRKGVLVELWPLRPDRMKIERVNGVRIYTYTQANGTPRTFRAEEIWHIPAFGFDGLMGYSRITLARNAIGLSLATEKYGSKFFANGANPGIVVKHPGKLSDEAYTNLKVSWEERKGVDNSHKVAILEEGMSIDKIGIPPDDAQFLETRKFQVDEIARMFRIPPHMLGATEKSTSWGTGIEQQELGYLSHTLRPWLQRIEQQAWKDLLLESEKQDLTIEHLVEELLRTDLAARMTAYVQAITNGIMTRNEVRERENMNPIEGLDEMLQPLNMTTVNNPQPAKTPARAYELKGIDPQPLIQDAVRRIVRREKHELSDAGKRWNDKPEKYAAWQEQFYKADLPTFMGLTFEPLVRGQLLDGITLQRAITEYCNIHGADPSSYLNEELSEGELIRLIQENTDAQTE